MQYFETLYYIVYSYLIWWPNIILGLASATHKHPLLAVHDPEKNDRKEGGEMVMGLIVINNHCSSTCYVICECV